MEDIKPSKEIRPGPSSKTKPKVGNIDLYVRKWFFSELVLRYFHQNIVEIKDYKFMETHSMFAKSDKIDASYELVRSKKDIKYWYLKEYRYLKSTKETKITVQKLQYTFEKLIPLDKKVTIKKGLIKSDEN